MRDFESTIKEGESLLANHHRAYGLPCETWVSEMRKAVGGHERDITLIHNVLLALGRCYGAGIATGYRMRCRESSSDQRHRRQKKA